MAGIVFESVSKRYGSGAGAPWAVQDISFEVPRGTLTTILGPSGCGKTTTLRLIAGLESPSAGRIWIDGQDVTTLGPAQRNVSMMFQSYALFPHLTVLENVRYGLRMSGVPRAAGVERARQALHGVGLQGFDARLPSELSGGQQQRVALARALVLEPAVLLFDEPLSNLDARLRREMREEIRALQQRLALTVAYVTHDQGEALAVSDQIIVMDVGHIAQSGTPQQLYEAPCSAFVAGFMGEAMLFAATADAQGQVALGPLAITPRQPVAEGSVQVAVRPEAWQIGPPGQGLAAMVAKRTYLGSGYEYTFDTALGAIFVVSADPAHALPVGAQAGLRLGAHGVSVVAAG
ncbi:iron(III) transport system ATP-binding protein [Oryzisolibacter propanilivorax]|uniref:Iron(III) transport system ATP-binding protein n=1 Tax=Oryzisolibacter propanilivorax TaxID=1527607 RepID=A0A1G9S9C4_9BURK|nr:ABC transporter ATP-binding protein [Oryzisolibacter propanilivorax]SDM31940.1 iron(III) transport system ATP-binding protein [Oryzisolibacter propanilivorax]